MMMTLETGTRDDLKALVEPIRQAVEHDRVTSLARTLAGLESRGAFNDPALYAAARPERYARRLIWADPHRRFVVVGMTWGPGQGAPLHDHAGTWGAEIVTAGLMRAVSYRPVDRAPDGRVRFVCEQDETSPPGSVGILIPPLEYHAFGNAGTAVAHTVHVYGGTMEWCHAYSADSDGWWRARRVELRYDA